MAKTMEDRGQRLLNPWRIAGWGIAGLMMLLPLVAMQFTDEVKWTAFDFAFAAMLIGGVGLAFELAVHATPNLAYRGGMAIALAAAVLLVWINGAVGIIGDEYNPLNLLYVGLIVLAVCGAALARWQSRGMARAMLATAIANIGVGAVAVIAGSSQPPGAIGLAAINLFFVALFLGASRLFVMAAGEEQTPRRN